MHSIPTGTDVSIDDIEVRRVTSDRTGKDPVIVDYAGAIIRVINGPTKNTWSAREMVLADLYDDTHRVGGRLHDAATIDRRSIRPTDFKTSTPDHRDRRRTGAMILRGRQHDTLMAVPDELAEGSGFADEGDYVFAVYERLEDLVVLLDNCRLSARDVDRICDPSFYNRGDDRTEASVEWTDIPGLAPEEMYARLDATPTYLRALGLDPDQYRDEIKRVREQVARVHAEQTTSAADAAETAEVVETAQTQ